MGRSGHRYHQVGHQPGPDLLNRAGFDGAWFRQRHLEHGVGSAAVFLAAAGQRTQRVELGTAVIPIGYGNPFRLAEDLARSRPRYFAA